MKIIGGMFRGRILKVPKKGTRPTTSMVREAVFNICADWVESARFLDLFAGSGAMGLEAISRGAAFATFVEKDRFAAQCIRENASLLEVEPQTQILCMEARRAVKQLLGHYDLIYIDPPYEKEIPEILEMVVSLLAPRGLLFLEERFSAKVKNISSLELVDRRRYGIAQLHQFRWAQTENLH